MKLTQPEIVVRYLFARKGEWTPSYQLVKQDTEWGYLGLQADRRAFELAKVGKWDSTNFTYYIERRKSGKYTEFRCTGRTKIEPFIEGVGRLPEQMTLV